MKAQEIIEKIQEETADLASIKDTLEMKNNAERLDGLTVLEPTEQDLNKWFAERQAKWELEEKAAMAAMRTHAARCVLRPKSALHAKAAQEYLQGKRDSLPWWCVT